MISYGKQHIDNEDLKSVLKTLRSDKITQGLQIKRFENSLKKKLKCKNALTVSSGTAALHLIAKSLEWKKGDLILISSITFVATSNIALNLGATVDFIDVNYDDGNISIKSLLKKILYYKKKNIKIKSVVVTDYGGLPADWHELYKLKKKYKFSLISDNCHSFGSKYMGSINYQTKYTDAASLSFHPVKHITTGEGGAILTNNSNIIKRCEILRSHGVIRNKSFSPWFYKVEEPGFNYRMSDINAALGVSQIKKLNIFIKRRKQIAKIYDNFFSKIDLCKIPKPQKNKTHSYHLYPLLIDFNKLHISKRTFFNKLKEKGIILQVHYIPIYRHGIFKNKKINYKELKNSELFYKNEISLPIFYSLKNTEINKVCKAIKKILDN